MGRYLPTLLFEETVIFPYQTVSMSLSDENMVATIDTAFHSAKQQLIIVPESIHSLRRVNTTIGTLARIINFTNTNNGLKIIIQGLKRVKIKSTGTKEGILITQYNTIRENKSNSVRIKALRKGIINLLYEFSNFIEFDPEIIDVLNKIEDPIKFSFYVSSHFPFSSTAKKKLLSTIDTKARLKNILELINSELEVAKTEAEIMRKVKDKISKSQKQFLLNEQLRIIREELGKEGDEEIEKLLKKIDKAKMPETAKEKAMEEIEKLKKTPSISPESIVIRNYLDWLVTLPWDKRTKDNPDIKSVYRILDKNHFGLKKVKDTIVEFLSVLRLSGSTKGHILCFVGAPGVGKTSLGKSIAEALGREFVRSSLGGVKDEAEIRGHRRTYVGSMPGKIIQQIARAKVKNPVFLLDEIDKIGVDYRGDPSSALLEVLDPEVNNNFMDHYIEVGFDLSEVLFITTANVTYSIPPALLDRMEIINLPGYLEFEKMGIAKKHLIPNVLKETGISPKELHLSDTAIKNIIQHYTREAGVRNLERSINVIARKIAKRKAFGENTKLRITANNLEEFLGPPRFELIKNKKNRVGVAMGLAVTPSGGETIMVESKTMEGTGKQILTGQLGEVMKESAVAALSLVRSNYKQFHLPDDFYKKLDIHVHIPEGAVPKDGPSAGITIFTSMLSALTGKSIRKDIAMTGEITLSGEVLPVGGLTEKIVAAQTMGIKTVIIPKSNKKDLKEIPKEAKKDLQIIPISNIKSLLKYVF